MDIVLFSSTNFGLRCFREAIVPCPEVNLAGIVTTRNTINISYSKTPVTIRTHADFSLVGKDIAAPVLFFDSSRGWTEISQWLEEHKPTLILVLGWYYMIPKEILRTALIGALGIHASMLPKYRGGAPISWAIINGECETGVTLFHIGEGIDTGDIVAQRRVIIRDMESWCQVYDRATWESIIMLREQLPLLQSGHAQRIPQDTSLATLFPQRSPQDGQIDWRWSCKRIHDFIRAQTKPYPGAFTFSSGVKIIFWSGVPSSETSNEPPGTMLAARNIGEDSRWVCGDGCVLIVHHKTIEAIT